MIFKIVLLLSLSAPLPARDNGQWAESPPHIRLWFQGLRQPDNPRLSCCGEADAFEADMFEVEGGHYVAIITDGKGMIPNGTRIPVPDRKMKWDEGNPTGHGIIFIGPAGKSIATSRPAACRHAGAPPGLHPFKAAPDACVTSLDMLK